MDLRRGLVSHEEQRKNAGAQCQPHHAGTYMGLGVRVEGKNAEKVRVHLLAQDLIVFGCRIHQEGGVVTFPVKDNTTQKHLEGIEQVCLDTPSPLSFSPPSLLPHPICKV
jgi:hypothetical protein